MYAGSTKVRLEVRLVQVDGLVAILERFLEFVQLDEHHCAVKVKLGVCQLIVGVDVEGSRVKVVSLLKASGFEGLVSFLLLGFELFRPLLKF